ncbi:L,D-transpeptidase [Nocardioides sp. JQ2195]|uniref:L,D-transpeptidase n=1 Tax=Nocardioides sp. JQ2195 TaxID=2592334 RepID=UPI00143EA74D|nr:Ig-like domain-containing protein [Nocardioides sp. JQ2195]QIX26293.1 L,D-transpeptidase [Nocardioides sp. JQ2195]
MSASRTQLRSSAVLASLALLAGGLSACSGTSGHGSDDVRKANGDASNASAQSVRLSANVGPKKVVPVDRLVTVDAEGGTIAKVVLRSDAGSKVPGLLNDGSTRWTATDRLEPGTSYVVRTTTRNEDGKVKRSTSSFTTQDLSLAQQTYASVAPLEGETVGVGMPVVVHFDLPVIEKKAFEKHMVVTSTPAQKGTWHWMSDTEVHYRPATYWQAGTDVTVEVDVNALPAGNGIYGQESRTVNFHIGDSVVSKVNAQTHQMKTFVNGKLVKTMPITLGKPGFTTRSGIKVIMEKYRTKRMNSETVGIPADSAEAYDIDDVEYAMRVTSTGEFLHAAPWSVGSQGYANVSHGCTGLSTANAAWIYNISKRGDVVEYTGTDRPMTLTNGYGDWNESFATYKQGSAL